MNKYFWGVIILVLLLSCSPKVAHRYTLIKDCSSNELNEFSVQNENGLFVLGGKYRNGELDGDFICCASTGETLSVVMYENGLKNGKTMIWYHPLSTKGKKQLKLECNFVNDTLDGKKTSWYENGNIRSKYEYKLGDIISAAIFNTDGSEYKETSPKIQAKKDELYDNKLFRENVNLINMADTTKCR